jgi:MarR family transcriptional regulator, organic hydroperoxide resistance regulator
MSTPELSELAPLSHAIFRVARLHKALAGTLLRQAGLHPGQELVLTTLWTRGPQRLVDLVAAVESDAPSMTRSVARMERAGLVSRTRSASDGRIVIVEATEASLVLRARVESAWRELERVTVQSLTPDQRELAMTALATLEEGLENGVG